MELLDLPARHATLDSEISCLDCRDNCSNNGIYIGPADLGTREGCDYIMYHIRKEKLDNAFGRAQISYF